MALKATIFKIDLNVADMDRQVYGDFSLTVARHPSETNERMMLRVLAFALHAADGLQFGKGLSTDDEPDLWLRNLDGEVALWIDLGTPGAARVRRACGRAREVVLYCYGGRAVSLWWDKNAAALARFERLRVFAVDAGATTALAELATASMDLQCCIQDGEVTVSGGTGEPLTIVPSRLN